MAESSIQHIPEYVSQVSVIERGEIVFQGTLEEARKHPALI
jgi:branched-chain amino acid transport system ATP-binding protein